MNILVCLSRVPDTNSKISISEDKKTINKNNIKYVMNPYDEYALEEALQIRTKFGGNITAISVGDEATEDILRSAYALGVDKSVVIKSEVKINSSFQLASAIAEFARTQSFDLILCGKQSIDYASEAIPIFLSEMLNVPALTSALKIEIEDIKVTVDKELDEGTIKMETLFPCIISVQKGINQPRYPKLPDIMKSKKKTVSDFHAHLRQAKIHLHEIKINQKQRTGKIVGDSQEEVREIIELLKTEAKVL